MHVRSALFGDNRHIDAAKKLWPSREEDRINKVTSLMNQKKKKKKKH